MSRTALSPQQAQTLSAVKQFPGRNATELAELAGGNPYDFVLAIRRRLPELHRLHLVMRDADGRYFPNDPDLIDDATKEDL